MSKDQISPYEKRKKTKEVKDEVGDYYQRQKTAFTEEEKRLKLPKDQVSVLDDFEEKGEKAGKDAISPYARDLTFKLNRQGQEDTEKNVKKELEKLEAEGYEILSCNKFQGHWIVYYRKKD